MTTKDRRGFLGLILGVVAAGAAGTMLTSKAEAAPAVGSSEAVPTADVENSIETTQFRRGRGRGGFGGRGRRGRVIFVQPRRRRRGRIIRRILRRL